MTQRERKLTPGLKYQIRWLVGRVHVGEDDEEVASMIDRRMTLDKFTPGCINSAREYAVKVHHDNQNLCKKYRL